MLAYILALSVGFFSLYLLATAFITPNIHRKDDFLWSAVGLFYALVLWLCAGQLKGAVLLGQTAVVILLIAIGWQNLNLRRVILSPDQEQALLGFSAIDWLQTNLGKVVSSKPKKAPIPVKAKEKATPVSPAPTAKVEPVATPDTSSEKLPEPVTTVEELDNWGESDEEVKEEIKPIIYDNPVITTPEPLEELDNWGESTEAVKEDLKPMIYETPLTETPESWQEENIPSVTPLSFIDDVNETENLEDQEKIEPQQAEIEKVETEVIETVIVNIESTAEITDSEKQQEILEIVEAAAEIGTIESVEITTTDTIVISLETPEEKESQD